MSSTAETTFKPGLRAAQFTKCCSCGKGVGGNIFFYRVTVEHHVLDTRAIQRQHGLEQIVGKFVEVPNA